MNDEMRLECLKLASEISHGDWSTALDIASHYVNFVEGAYRTTEPSAKIGLITGGKP